MRVPQMNERVKEAPAHALRAIFAGIGQLLSVSDKVRNKPAATKTATAETASPDTAAPEMRSTRTAAPAAAPKTAAPETATPETTVPETAVPETATPEAAAPGTMTPEPVTPEAGTPEPVTPEATAAPNTGRAGAGGHVKLVPSDETAEAPAASPSIVNPDVTPAVTVTGLPLANYDDLTIASLRARLRNLSADQLTELVAYERSHANRPDVISMFERRIAKLAEG